MSRLLIYIINPKYLDNKIDIKIKLINCIKMTCFVLIEDLKYKIQGLFVVLCCGSQFNCFSTIKHNLEPQAGPEF